MIAGKIKVRLGEELQQRNFAGTLDIVALLEDAERSLSAIDKTSMHTMLVDTE